jgi:FkbM family methyltransferase
MKYKDHENQNLDTALAERIQECLMSYPRPRSKMNLAVDVGANIGGFACSFHSSFEKVVCIEANPDSVECLNHNLNKLSITNVKVYSLAASDERGKKIKLFKIDEGEDSHSGNCGTEWDKNSSYKILEEEEVVTTDLDEVFSLCGESFIDYLKVDCEGAEYNFLINKDLSNIRFIIGEYHPGVIGDKLESLWEHIRKTHELNVSDNHLFIAQLRNDA